MQLSLGAFGRGDPLGSGPSDAHIPTERRMTWCVRQLVPPLSASPVSPFSCRSRPPRFVLSSSICPVQHKTQAEACVFVGRFVLVGSVG